jgi:SpoVK/Ycf46/Vps4 family AAA+-type ATPase
MAGASVALTHCAADYQLLTCLDDLSFESCDRKAVMVIGATNRPDSLDAALRRAGRCVGLLTVRT